MVTKDTTFAVLHATEEERVALEETRRAIEDVFFEEIDELESALMDHMDAEGRRLYAELDRARWRRGCAMTEAVFSEGKRLTRTVDLIAARSEAELAAAGRE